MTTYPKFAETPFTMPPLDERIVEQPPRPSKSQAQLPIVEVRVGTSAYAARVMKIQEDGTVNLRLLAPKLPRGVNRFYRYVSPRFLRKLDREKIQQFLAVRKALIERV